ncbi:hypothetical protein [Hyalangium sp.]|uniref:hypothetical protein n=1 Tax=Hyalangium sp. TaxID=2028555 RepID=UPI002D3D9E67|nr:hypothetical protein [Hyalangium sp.]HYH96723.1 hypothetical protein [Hyalangium sp.]
MKGSKKWWTAVSFVPSGAFTAWNAAIVFPTFSCRARRVGSRSSRVAALSSAGVTAQAIGSTSTPIADAPSRAASTTEVPPPTNGSRTVKLWRLAVS